MYGGQERSHTGRAYALPLVFHTAEVAGSIDPGRPFTQRIARSLTAETHGGGCTRGCTEIVEGQEPCPVVVGAEAAYGHPPEALRQTSFGHGEQEQLLGPAHHHQRLQGCRIVGQYGPHMHHGLRHLGLLEQPPDATMERIGGGQQTAVVAGIGHDLVEAVVDHAVGGGILVECLLLIAERSPAAFEQCVDGGQPPPHFGGAQCVGTSAEQVGRSEQVAPTRHERARGFERQAHRVGTKRRLTLCIGTHSQIQGVATGNRKRISRAGFQAAYGRKLFGFGTGHIHCQQYRQQQTTCGQQPYHSFSVHRFSRCATRSICFSFR